MKKLFLCLFIEIAAAFRPPIFGISSKPALHGLNRLYSSSLEHVEVDTHNQGSDAFAVRAPLKYIGPYPSLALRFPDLATSSQRARNVTGVSLDFVLDTAANVNTLNAQVAEELKLPTVGMALPGVGAAGAIESGGTTYELGTCQLEGVGNFTFMTGLTASALPVASPAAAGLLSFAFLQPFNGVLFHWNPSPDAPPYVSFFDWVTVEFTTNMKRVVIDRIPVTQLPSITIKVNGIEMTALLDTGSPITVLNAQAAKQAGITTVQPPSGFLQQFQQAQAAARGDILSILGADGKRVDLYKSTETVSIASGSDDGSDVDFGSSNVFVGDLPGLQALNGLGVDSPPAVVLGMDVLRKRPNMLLRAQQNEVWF